MPFISKYVVESAVVIFAFIICAFQFLIHDAIQAISVLTIFMAAGSRIAPASLRIQQSAITIKTYLGVSQPTLDLARDLENVHPNSQSLSKPDFIHSGFVPQVTVQNATFQYDSSTNFAIRDFNLEILPGRLVAIVGTTGSGKTTIVDLLLGIHEITGGEIKISGERPMDAIVKWPGGISYVPQDIMIVNGTIRDNVALGFDPANIDDAQVWEAIDSAQLGNYVRGLPLQLLSQVGERGTKLSGGQRQRLGIARALFTKPKLLVLDEATSALDAETEKQVAQAIAELHGNVTLIIIAHRLSTVQKADTVVYMENGTVLAEGNFDFVRESVQNFDQQAKLMGL
jgi:ABC-type multidrug transport system fused ATPase/permease subunit